MTTHVFDHHVEMTVRRQNISGNISYHADLTLDGIDILSGFATQFEPVDFWFACDQVTEAELAAVVPYIARFLELAREYRAQHP